MRMMPLRRNGTPWLTLHSIRTVQNTHRVIHMCAVAVVDVEEVGGEGELQTPWVEDEARIQKVTLLRYLPEHEAW